MFARTLLSTGLTFAVAMLAVAPSPTSATPPASTNSVTFTSTGASQTWQVPTGVTVALVEAVGGNGAEGDGDLGNGQGGNGGQINAALMLPDGTNSVIVNAGGNASGNQGGWNGGADAGAGDISGSAGGGGGGATDLRIGGTDPIYRVLVAGGGGGGGGANGEGSGSGNGGDAGTNNGQGSPGTGGSGDSSPGAPALYQSGNGGQGASAPSYSNSGGGGGGGGGYAGGQGGGSGGTWDSTSVSGAGAGAGSSQTISMQYVANPTYSVAGSDAGYVTLTWIDITTTALPALTVSSPLTTSLQATWANPLTWTVAVGGLPAGLDMSPEGVITGTPSTPGPYTFTASAFDPTTDALSQITYTGIVTGAPTVQNVISTAVTSSAATINALVSANNLAVTAVDCRVATTPAGVQTAESMSASPASLDDTASDVAVACPLTGLVPNTTYYANVYATDTQATGNGTATSFTTAPSTPNVVTALPSAISPTTANGLGTVNPYNQTATVGCQIGTTIATLNSAPIISAAPSTVAGSTAQPVTCQLTGLITDTSYVYRIVATNTTGTTNGDPVNFTTGQSPPTVDLVNVSATGHTFTTVAGTVIGTGEPVTNIFCKYATTSDDVLTGTTVEASPSTGAADAAVPAACSLTGLNPNTDYFVSMFATAAAGTTHSVPVQFRTSPVQPTFTIGNATNVTTTSVHINATVNTPQETLNSVWCQYSTAENTVNSGIRIKADPPTVASGSLNAPVVCTLDDLHAGTVYYVKFYASYGDATVSSDQAQVTTLTAAPTVRTRGIDDLTTTSATLSGTVSANGSATAVQCRVSTVSSAVSEGTVVTATPSTVAAAVQRKPVFCDMSGLTANTQYYATVFATNGDATTSGTVVTFTTDPSAPIVKTHPSTDVGTSVATGHGTVSATGEDVTQIYCTLIDSAQSFAEGLNVPATPATLLSSARNVPVICNFGALVPNQKYAYRVYAVDQTGTATSASVARFITHSQAPTLAASSVVVTSAVSASVNFSVNPNNVAASNIHCSYATSASQVGLESASVAAAAPSSVPASSAATAGVCSLVQLVAGQTYFVAVSATNAAGTTVTPTVSFTTTGKHGPAVKAPSKLRTGKWVKLLSGPTYSLSGSRVTVSVRSLRGRSDGANVVRLVRKRDGRVFVKVMYRHVRVQVVWSAPAVPFGSGYRLARTYRSTR